MKKAMHESNLMWLMHRGEAIWCATHTKEAL